MKSFFALAFCLLSSVFAQCDEAPDRDLDIFAVFELSSSYGHISSNRANFVKGLTAAAEWVEAAGFEVKSSTARSNDGDRTPNCYVQDSQEQIGSAKLSAVVSGGNIGTNNGGRATTFLGLLWARQTFWADARLTESVRRIFYFVTHEVHQTAYEPARGGFVVLSDSVLQGTPQNACKALYVPNRKQVAEALQGAKAAVMAISYPVYSTQAGRANTWRSFFASAGITDVHVPNRPASAANMASYSENGVKLLMCPSWLKSTTTHAPTGFTGAQIRSCLDLVKPCQDNLSEWKGDLESCLLSNF